ncbi:HalOD1 output domain-containing protein [Haladaptatus pallidirubidus]|uniref:Halobacterial output domain-containing protein n=1 Tax=Haladaptatus pallidirubidus TaxID=1008152 RepID=A0AAV3UF15_9EURY|nr:HalOD1 output domain-containing protein [Haladaptatus pallidirubidus]
MNEDGSPDKRGVHRVKHDLASSQSLSTTVTVAVADVAGVEPAEIPEQLYDVIDPEALDKLFKSRDDGTSRRGGRLSFSLYGHHVTVRGDGSITVQPGLARIKQLGGNLLVVGSVPDSVVDTASTPLLGETSRNRTRLFALHDRSISTARSRLSMAGSIGKNAYIVDYHTDSRSTVAEDSVRILPEIERIDGDIDDFRDKIVATIRRLDAERGGFEPAELRFCFDTLRPLVETHDDALVDAFLGPICEALKDVSGMAHYVLPIEYDSPPVRAITSKFDAIVELRAGDSGPEQRWHLRETNYTTEWFDI